MVERIRFILVDPFANFPLVINTQKAPPGCCFVGCGRDAFNDWNILITLLGIHAHDLLIETNR